MKKNKLVSILGIVLAIFIFIGQTAYGATITTNYFQGNIRTIYYWYPLKTTYLPNTTSIKTTSQISVFQYEQKVLELVNAERAKYGLKSLLWDAKLAEVARIKSMDMRDKNYFSHTSPTYGSPFEMMKNFGITYNYAGENIAAGQTTPETVVQAWMNSEGHRKNILNPNYTHLGVGYASGGAYKHYWTQMFIGK